VADKQTVKAKCCATCGNAGHKEGYGRICTLGWMSDEPSGVVWGEHICPEGCDYEEAEDG